MNLKEENKMLRRENFELRLELDMNNYRDNNDFEYRNLINYLGVGDESSLLNIPQSYLLTLKPLIAKYSFETIEKYFLNKKAELDKKNEENNND